MPFDSIITTLKRIIPRPLIEKLLPIYHWLWAAGSALYYRLPGRHLYVIMVTGSKGKTTTVEMINAILESAGFQTAVASTLRFKVRDRQTPNRYKMSVPGRGLMQRFLRNSVNEGCDVAIMEMTSQAVLNHRHKFLFPNALVFTNLEPEHIEAHGGYENYREAKLNIADEIKKSFKMNKAIIANLDNQEGRKFATRAFSSQTRDYSYSFLNEASKVNLENHISFKYKKNTFLSNLQGAHNASNLLAAIKTAEFMHVTLNDIATGIKNLSMIRGRLESIDETEEAGFETYVDYAHTPESLRAVYNTFPNHTKIAVLGNAGGGRDTWKRAEMAKIAEECADHIILTDEDPYDEDPKSIVDEMYQAIQNQDKVETEMDRRVAIRKALEHARNIASKSNNVVVLVTGKGTDPYIMRANDNKEPWDDATVVREELARITKD